MRALSGEESLFILCASCCLNLLGPHKLGYHLSGMSRLYAVSPLCVCPVILFTVTVTHCHFDKEKCWLLLLKG
jgi:hypothetical protein